MSTSSITRLCLTCDTPFHPQTGKKRVPGKYCSRKCWRAREGTFAERFWRKVQKTKTCWEWIGYRDRDGYGRVCSRRANKVSWEMHNGPIPDGMFVLHHCDNPPCVRPDHLFLGTNRDNVDDMMRKNRQLCGAKSGRSKLSDEQVKTIRQRFTNGSASVALLAREFAVCTATIYNVVRGITYRCAD